MRLPDWLRLLAVVTCAGLLFVLWTEHAYRRGYDAASAECYEGSY